MTGFLEPITGDPDLRIEMLVEEAAQLDRLETITARQRVVMDLVVQHHTSKEIARRLGIAPNTVDQRINAVREKLGARDRAEAARLYAQLLTICGESTYGSAVIDSTPHFALTDAQDDDLSPVFTLHDAASMSLREWRDGSPIRSPGAKFLESKVWRLVIIVAIAAGVALATVATLTIMTALNDLV